MRPEMRPCVLVFAGVDPSGGAGIAADVEAIGAVGGHPLPVVTALTVQDNNRVAAVYPVDAGVVGAQAEALLRTVPVAAVKIGIVGHRANAEAIADLVRRLRVERSDLPVVFDPVLGSGGGDALSADDPLHAVEPLFPVATLVTPNLVEAQRLCGGESDAATQADMLLARGCANVLIKGGHGEPDAPVVNTWFSAAGSWSWTWERLAGAFHGSGCTLASAIAARLAAGDAMPVALLAAQAYVERALQAAYPIGPGQLIPERRIPFAV